MPIAPEAAFILLSDLHFGDDLLLEANGPLPNVPWWLRAWDRDVKQYFDERCTAHDIAILKSLPRYLKRLLVDIRNGGFPRDDFDLYLVLGDQVTRPTGSAYKFLREYLTQKHYETGDSELTHKCAGLQIPSDRLLLIPGNHDKLLMTDLGFYQNEMLKPLRLSTEPSAQSCHIRLQVVGQRKFLFFLVDASVYAGKENTLDTTCRNHLAAGEITSELRKSILAKVEALKKKDTVDNISLADYTSATRILVVHYAVDVQSVCGVRKELENLILPHECKGLAELIDELSEELHLVLHGHLHKAKLYKRSGVNVVAATTTSQRGDENGFFLLKFFESGEIATEHHRWYKNGFLLDSNASLNQLLGRVNVAR